MQKYSSEILDSINNENITKDIIYGIFFILTLIYLQFSSVEASLGGSRPQYIYDRAEILNEKYRIMMDNYLRQLDDSTAAEIVVYTIPSFVGHGIKKNGQEIQDRDTLANYIFNEVPLDGITGIGKKGKDNGILVLLSLSSDASGGSMRVEVGRGLEGNITDGIAGEILDTYLVPAKERYVETKNITAINQGLLDTVVSLGKYIGYTSSDSQYNLTKELQQQDGNDYFGILFFIMIFLFVFLLGFLRRGRRGRIGRRYWGGGWYGSSGGRWSGGGGNFGGFSGGGGRSGGGGAGR